MRTLAWAALVLALPASAGALIPGGGNPGRDCFAEFAGENIRLNYPAFDPARPRPAREVRCFDGEFGCDLDGVTNNSCTFDVDVCLANTDFNLPECTPSQVSVAQVRGATSDPELGSLHGAINALLPANGGVCTSGQTLTVPLDGPGPDGVYRRTRKSVRVTARTLSARDNDRLRLTCVPRGWPSHGYDQRNTRATPLETQLSTANAAGLTLAWAFDVRALEGGSSNAVTGTPTVGFGNVYFGSWNGKVYAVDAHSGALRWKYDTLATFLGVQGSVTLTADGRALVGDSHAVLHALDAQTGRLLWKTALGNPAVDHIWASPTVARNKVVVGLASHSDNPCTKGRLLGVDLDTGAVLWTLQTVPSRICNNDTSIACNNDAMCGAGTCVESRGAGITASVAVDPSGEAVYMNTVGCFTFPSVGDSDSIFKVDTFAGVPVWKKRVQPPEQFRACSNDGSIDCTSNADCGAGTCTTKTFYHDFGFINGPLVVEADDGIGGTRPLVVSASKDGTVYALDPANGATVWTNPVLPTPVTPAFAGFGLFNGAVAFAEQRFYAALYQFAPAVLPAPDHLMAFSAVDGTIDWSDEIGVSWAHVSYGGGLIVTGTQGANEVYVYDAANGVRLATLSVPGAGTRVSAGASIVDGMMYVAYGVFGAEGGVQAYVAP